MSVIRTDHLTKFYGDLCAVDDVSLEVGQEVFGLLGPNGAGKSTIVKMLTTLLKPSKGSARVCGHDVGRDAVGVRRAISYVPQEMALDIKLTGRENVVLFARLYGVPDAKGRADEAIGLMGLTDRADELVRGYSGGMRRRLELAQALVHEPRVLFLDEPTLGLDVAARKKIWEHIYTLKEKGMTIFMTTHYMDEADRYCDRVAIIDRGKIAAIGTPESLKAGAGPSIVTASVTGEFHSFSRDGVRLAAVGDHEITFRATDGKAALGMVTDELRRQGLEIHAIAVRESTLDDAFLQMVTAGEEQAGFDGSRYRLMLRRR